MMMIKQTDVQDHPQQLQPDESIYYGNLKPSLWKLGRPRIFLGPQPIIFFGNFIIALSLITLLQFLTHCPLYQRLLGISLHVCFLWNLLSIGLSSPGLAAQYRTQTNQTRGYCDKCRVQMVRGTRHCVTCDVCVAEYDHHCVFLGKCIGRENMGEFKAVLCCVFVNLGYFGVVGFINNPHF